jgi:hypothetical protein
VRRWFDKSWVKGISLTDEMPAILSDLSTVEVCRIDGVAVKCIDTIRNTNCEGSILSRN